MTCRGSIPGLCAFFRWSFKSYSLEFCFDTPVFHCTLSIVACVADETKPRYSPIPGFSFVCNAGYFNSKPFVLLEMSIRGSWSREVVELLRINILNLVVKVLILTVLISFLWRSFLKIHEPGPLSLKSSVQGVWAHQHLIAQRDVGVLVSEGKHLILFICGQLCSSPSASLTVCVQKNQLANKVETSKPFYYE